MIHTRGLTKKYGDLVAVDHLDLDVRPGELFGFLGPNGAGKTTTIRMLTGLLQPSEGAAQVAGFDVRSQTLDVKASIGYLAERPFLYDKLTGREYLRFIGGLYRVPAETRETQIARLLELFDLQEKADSLIETHSHGMRQKIGICSLLVHSPKALFLDEPTNGLDPRSARLVKEILRGLCARGTTVFMSTHVLEIAEHMCDRVGIIHQGGLVAVGSLNELRAQRAQAGSSLEDIFLEMTGGAEVAELTSWLREG